MPDAGNHQLNHACSVYELRQYTLRPGQRDVLIELFDREFIESQEAVGMRIVGQFRDLDRADHFVWIRGFRDMAARAAALAAFYGGPVWKEHRDAANATMVDSDDVLLLRPVDAGFGFAEPVGARRPVGFAGPPAASIVVATLYYCSAPVDDEVVALLTSRVEPLLRQAGARPLATLQIEPAENTFPALPVRTGEHVLAAFASFASEADHHAYLERLDRSRLWTGEVLPELMARLTRPPEQLRLAPTVRSQLR
jgi:hypothetical protein